jgi:hypothetical protein
LQSRVYLQFGIADKTDLTYAALAEGPGAFIQAVINYRQKLGPGIKNDKIFSDSTISKCNLVCEKVKQFGIQNKLNMIRMPLMCKTGTGQNNREAAFLVWNENYMIYVIIYLILCLSATSYRVAHMA